VANNGLYLQALSEQRIPCEREMLHDNDRLNEYIMTALRTARGLDLDYIEQHFGRDHASTIDRGLQEHILQGLVHMQGRARVVRLTRAGKLLADRLASELFIV